jgi:hypothetical protein
VPLGPLELGDVDRDADRAVDVAVARIDDRLEVVPEPAVPQRCLDADRYARERLVEETARDEQIARLV